VSLPLGPNLTTPAKLTCSSNAEKISARTRALIWFNTPFVSRLSFNASFNSSRLAWPALMVSAGFSNGVLSWGIF
jgi:hypothetical protein